MDSIDENQAEENRGDLTGREAVERIREVVEGQDVLLLHSRSAGGEGRRPMNVQQVDDEGNLWFLSATTASRTRRSRRPVRRALLPGIGPLRLHLGERARHGLPRQGEDRRAVGAVVKTWFTGGMDDPRITAIKVVPTEGYYWDTKHGRR